MKVKLNYCIWLYLCKPPKYLNIGQLYGLYVFIHVRHVSRLWINSVRYTFLAPCIRISLGYISEYFGFGDISTGSKSYKPFWARSGLKLRVIFHIVENTASFYSRGLYFVRGCYTCIWVIVYPLKLQNFIWTVKSIKFKYKSFSRWKVVRF